MELAMLVYVVENLTYGGTFWGSMAVFLFLLTAGAYTVNIIIEIYNSRQKETVTKSHSGFREGACIILSYQVDDLLEGVPYEVRWVCGNSVKFKNVKDCYKEYDLVNLSAAVVYRTDTIPAKVVTFKFAKLKLLMVLTGLCVMLDVVLPTRQTAIYIGGAYLTQQVVTSDVAKDVGDRAQKILISQLDKWAEEVPELKDMVAELATNNQQEGEPK